MREPQQVHRSSSFARFSAFLKECSVSRSTYPNTDDRRLAGCVADAAHCTAARVIKDSEKQRTETENTQGRLAE